MDNSDNSNSNPVYIKKIELQDEHDFKKISKNLNQNRILFVQTKLYFESHRDDIITLRKTMNQLKQICLRNGGSMGRIGEDILVLTPNPQIRLF
ncbi:MAG: hypothetical protein ACTSVZ_02540 [Promethearchaeota archaeon]